MKAKAMKLPIGLSELADNHLCPNCGRMMAEVDRINENGFSFIWYECIKDGCDEQ